MSIMHLELPGRLTSTADEIALAEQVEAGVYAAWLRDQNVSHYDGHELTAVVAAGKRAWQQLWLSNLRLVIALARDAARSYRLSIDDLFQEGALGLAEAIRRFDCRRGTKLATFAYDYIYRAIGAAANRRCGEIDGPLHRHRVRNKLSRAVESLSTHESRQPSIREAAQHAGVPLATAVAASAASVSIDQSEVSLPDPTPEPAEFLGYGTEFLELLGESGALLKARFGIGCRARTQRELATDYGVSASTIARLETVALRRAKQLLNEEFCQLPQAS